jgi:hypothetical protein
MENQLVVQEKRGALTLKNVSTYGLGATVAGAMVLAPTANAAAVLDFSGVTEEIAGVQTSTVALIGSLCVLIGIGIAWAYFKRTAK